MDDLSEHIEKLRTEYRRIFIETVKLLEAEVLSFRPENFSGEIFEYYENNSAGRVWQNSVLNYLRSVYYPQIIELQAEINDMRKKYSCSGCGACCKLAVSEFSPAELKQKAQNGDKFAKQFIQIFIPYETIEEVKTIYPEYLKLLSVQKETGYYFYHCPKVTDDNRCPDYENRPQICRDFPDNPAAFLPLTCGYCDWKERTELIYLKLTAMSEVASFYLENLNKLHK